MKKITKILKKGGKFLKSPIQDYIKSAGYRRAARYARYLKGKKVEDIILYESFHGKGMIGNPYGMFKYLLDMPGMEKYKHVWVLDSILNKEDVIQDKYLNKKNIIFIKRQSRDYIKYLSSAKYLINNVTFPDFFQKKDDQIYINTWHGTPLKCIGKDVCTNSIDAGKNIIKNMISADYIINQNEFTTEKCKSAFELEDIYRGEVIEEGYPRTDLILNTNKEEVKERLREIGIVIKNPVILYAPTWRETSSIELKKVMNDIKLLKQKMEGKYDLVLKLHHLQYQEFKKIGGIEGVFSIPDYMDVNEILSIVDILITDYSSIFFDYLITNKPILFYMYDKDEYLSNRGVYIELEEGKLPGKVCTELGELIECIESVEDYIKEYSELYKEFLDKFIPKQHNRVTSQICDYIFKNQGDIKVRKLYNKDKVHVLCYGGTFQSNGITSSFINLLDNIDYDKYAVTIVSVSDKSAWSNIEKVNKNVHIIYRFGIPNKTIKEDYLCRWIYKNGVKDIINSESNRNCFFEGEVKRVLGDLRFDIVLDFGGYSPFWGLFLLHAKGAKKKYIYQHSDMKKEYITREHLRKNLSTVFSLYKSFDKVISVSKILRDINRSNYYKIAKNSEFVAVPNLIRPKEIERLSQEEEYIVIDDEKSMILDEDISFGRRKVFYLPYPKEEDVNFVIVGRISKEKDHEKLINAFADVCRQYPQTKLYIIGNGPEEKKIRVQAHKNKLRDNVILTGALDNPFYIMKLCDCFVLSSNYEGQPMVLLEALALNMPIIATNIDGNRGVLGTEYGMLVDNSIEGLKKGMIDFIEKGIEKPNFSGEIYNKQALTIVNKEILTIN